MTDWPSEYDATNLGRPHWTVQQALDVGRALANLMTSNRGFAERYLSTVKKYYADFGEHSTEYFQWFDEAIRNAGLHLNTQGCNAHDFANVHRAAWLFMLEPFACLVDKNPHVDGNGNSDWGDPALVGSPSHRTISRGSEDLTSQASDGNETPIVLSRFFVFHNIPNATGAFAISTDDIPAPPLSR